MNRSAGLQIEQGGPQIPTLLGERAVMASDVGDDKVIMAYELSGDDTSIAPSHHKRTTEGNAAGNASSCPTKRQKVVGEQQVHDLVPEGEALAQEDRAHQRTVADGFLTLTRALEDMRGRLAGSKDDLEKAILMAKALELTCNQRGYRLGDAVGNLTSEPASEPKNTVQTGCSMAVDAIPTGPNVVDSDAPPSPGSSSDGSIGVLHSVTERQKDDPELRKKVHEVETDYWLKRVSRDTYNEERFKLYTQKEAKEARIVWPRRNLSPAGYRENELEFKDHRTPGWTDMLLEFGRISGEGDSQVDEEAAKQRLIDKINNKFMDPAAQTAEHKRWEKIRDVETKYEQHRLWRQEYNEQRFALYTKEERKQKGIVWPTNKHYKRCLSPAGFLEDAFSQYDRSEERPDWQTRMDFHYPYALSPTDRDEKNLCELCIPLIEEHRLSLEAERRRIEELEAKRRAEEEEQNRKRRLEMEERDKLNEKKRKEKALARQNGIPCPECNRKFVNEAAVKSHAAAKHKKEVTESK